MVFRLPLSNKPVQQMKIVRYILVLLLVLVWSVGLPAEPVVDTVLVRKGERKMQLLSAGEVIRTYRISLGANPDGHKQREGDQRTPEGTYLLDYKKKDSAFYRATHISYPNEDDVKRAAANKVDPGGQIMIHGQRNGYEKFTRLFQRFDWTGGCIAVTNREMDEIWELVEVNTPIIIEP